MGHRIIQKKPPMYLVVYVFLLQNFRIRRGWSCITYITVCKCDCLNEMKILFIYICCVSFIFCRPSLPVEIPDRLHSVLESCWNPDSRTRPTCSTVLNAIKKAKPSKKSVLDCMMAAVESYAGRNVCLCLE